MSMETLTILQLTGMFCAYLLVTVGLPAFVFGGKLHGHSAPERFMLYFMTGNFYIMNLVFVLQLLKISHPATLILGTLIPALTVRFVINRTPVRRNVTEFAKYFRRLTGGQLGGRTVAHLLFTDLRRQICRFRKWIGHFLIGRFFDCALVAVLLVALWQIYGQNLLHYYGYKASDLIVHNYWINALSDNNIFVAGVYPHGFHNILYYLHAVFGIEVFVLLRLFAFVQNVMLHLMLLLVLRLCCKSRYAAYAGTILFVISNYFRINTYSRYGATLPQEFGEVFILPAVYFLFAFFAARGKELEAMPPVEKKTRRFLLGKKAEAAAIETAETIEEPEEAAEETAGTAIAVENVPETKGLKKWFFEWRPKQKRKKREYTDSWICLAGFCMSFSMTLAVHFYGTMIAGLFCIAVAIGYSFLIFRKSYFRSILSAGLLSVGIAVLPMLLAFLGGTPLEGSLRWGLGVINSGNEDRKEDENGNEEDSVIDESLVRFLQSLESSEDDAPGEPFSVFVDGVEYIVYPDGSVDRPEESSEEEEQLSFVGRVKHVFSEIKNFRDEAWAQIAGSLNNNVFYLQDTDHVKYILYAFPALIGLGLLYLLFRQDCYGAMLVSTGFYMLIMCLLLNAGYFGLPTLMDANRGSIYFAYSVPLALTLLLDGILYLPFFPMKNKAAKVGSYILNFLSMACVAGALYYTAETGHVRTSCNPAGQEMNEAVLCLTNIIHTEKDFTWTIVSANDELRMGWYHGFHYETVEFLEDMEELDEDTWVRIPTPVVFFYIEKVPIDYNVHYENSGQSVSEEGAAQPLPPNAGIYMYQGERRWIIMSRMYYWAEEFKKAYPDEMEVYLETDEFVCYRLEQNPYRLYNFAMDYGYNDRYQRQIEE